MIKKQLAWPSQQLAREVMMEGVTLVSRESMYMRDKNITSEADAWLVLFTGNTSSNMSDSSLPAC